MMRMMPSLVLGVAMASLMFVTCGCVSKSEHDATVGELKAQADKLAKAEKDQKDTKSEIKEVLEKVADKIDKRIQDLAG